MFNMTNKTYDIMKDVAQLWLPGLAALYVGLAKLWGLPFGAEISGSIMLLDTFLGTVLKISSAQYKAN